MTSAEPKRPDFYISRWLFLRMLGVVHLIAFVSLWTQIHGLVGSNGILPAADFLERAQDARPDAKYQLPTLCWIDSSDGMLHALCATGVVASLLLIVGLVPVVSLVVLWLVYLSLSIAGQAFLGFQWDTLLLETTFFATFLAPLSLTPRISRERRPPRLARWLMWWLLFKLMFLSGVTKLLSGDETWRDLTAMNFHYQTQPIPNGISWYMHHLPESFHKAEVIAMFVIELGVPLLICSPRLLRHAACVLLILLQVGVELTGNFGFFNLLTIALCIPLLDDHLLRRFVPRRWTSWLGEPASEPSEPADPRPRNRKLAAAACLPLIAFWLLSFFAFVEEMVRTQKRETLPRAVVSVLDGCDRWLLSWSREPISRWVGPFRTFNGYGLFRVMTTERPEIVVEGSDDGVTWTEYDFRWKPGDVRRAPSIVAPHQPRLDWQMWFAALNPRGNQYWLVSLMRHLLEGTPEVQNLLGENPFPDQPPKYVRLVFYRYEFTDAEMKRETGYWWQRKRLGATLPVSRRRFSVQR